VSGAVTAGITATAGVAFYGMNQVIGGMGSWEVLIGGVLLIITAITNPEGIAGGIRLQVTEKRRQKEMAKQEKSALASA
jgi:branched-chain amino acid transport system permease protein